MLIGLICIETLLFSLSNRKTNRLEESKNIFDTIVNNTAFQNISIILFLNKSDLLATKVKNPETDIRWYYPQSSCYSRRPNLHTSNVSSSSTEQQSSDAQPETTTANLSSLHHRYRYSEYSSCFQLCQRHNTPEESCIAHVTMKKAKAARDSFLANRHTAA